VLSYKQQPGKGMDYIEYAGTGGDGGGVQPVPRWQHVLGFDWTYGAWSVTLENNYVRGWTESATLVENNVGVSTAYHVKNSSRWNLGTSYKFNRNLAVRLGVKNLLDAEPPFTAVSSYGSHAGGYASSFVDPRGRYFYGSMTFTFK
jgi:iron complex outermembrane receptor protein